MRTSHRGGFIESLEPRRLLSISLLADFNTISAPSNAHGLVTLGSTGYFIASDGVHGYEPWQTDGTPAGTTLFMDLDPVNGPDAGLSGSISSPLMKVGGLLYFTADVNGDFNLWRTDGTVTGTFKLTTAGTDQNQFITGEVTDYNGVAIFGTSHFGVWRSDGTVAGTQQIAAVSASSVAKLGDEVFFVGAPSSGGATALWKTDGTAAGTSIVRQFSGSNNSRIYSALGKVFFSADDGTGIGSEPWSSDGTAAGTVLLGDVSPLVYSASLADFSEYNGSAYFTILTVSPAPSYDQDVKLYRSDGTAGSAVFLNDMGSAFDYYQSALYSYNNSLYFRSRYQLWQTDGTPAGTAQFTSLSSPSGFITYNGRLYFKAATQKTGLEMFSTDGTVEGTILLKDIVPGSKGSDSYPSPAQVFNGRLFFRANDGFHGTEFWSTDGTAEGTKMFKDINSNTNDFNPSAFTLGPGGFHYFIAKGGRQMFNDGELWKTDGTAAGTSLVKDLWLLSTGGVATFTYANGLLLFASSESDGTELWRSDGTEAGTYQVKDIAPGPSSGLPDEPLIKVGDRVFFAATTDTGYSQRYGLWVSDGTEAGTQLVKAADAIFALENFSGIEYKGKLIFHASSESNGRWADASIFVSDGTLEGTMPLRDGFRNVAATNWTVFKRKVYFAATTSAGGTELWSSDGTPDGTVMVADIYDGTGSSSPGAVVATADALYFAATDPDNGRELWRIDKETSKPVRLTTLTSDVEQVRASARGGVIFTTAASEIYRFDGSSVTPLKTSGYSVAPNLLGSARKLDYFSAGTSAAGIELWRTDGTAMGTAMVVDLDPGPSSSVPQNFSEIGRSVFLSARIPTVGRELFVLSPFPDLTDGSLELEATERRQADFAPASNPFADSIRIRNSAEDDVLSVALG